jgi:hypothetical protein
MSRTPSELLGQIINPQPRPMPKQAPGGTQGGNAPLSVLIGRILTSSAGRVKRGFIIFAATAGVSACLGAEAAQLEPTLDEIRAANARFQDVNIALAEGYIPDPSGMCVTAEMEGRPAEAGAMGIHYLRPDLLQITSVEPRVNGNSIYTDFMAPAILIYEPQADGSLELVAVENLVFRKAWYEAGNLQPPVFRGVQFDRMVDDPATEIDEAHGFEPHYDLHLWLYRDNPDGVYSPFNTNVTCRHHQQAGSHRH